MKIAIASDASGFRLKEHVKQVLREAGHDVTDVGQQREDEAVRYYEAGELLARAIQSGAYERGFVMCGSGAGVCMTAYTPWPVKANIPPPSCGASQTRT